MRRTDIIALVNQEQELTLEVVASRAGIHPAQLRQLVDFGLIQALRRQDAVLLFDASTVPRIRMIHRLRRDLGINLEGVAVVLELLDKLRALQRENELLRWRL